MGWERIIAALERSSPSPSNARANLAVQLKLKSCEVRSWRMADAEPLARHANKQEDLAEPAHAFPHPYTRHDAREFIQSVSNRTPRRRLRSR